MDIFDKLISASSNKESLSAFIEDNTQEIYDFLLTQSFEDLTTSKNRIEDFILQNLGVIGLLDFSSDSTKTFISLLLDVSERFSFFMSFQRLHKLLVRNNCEIGSRLEASSYYLKGVNSISDYNERISCTLEKLSESYNYEEDSEDRVVGAVINYYAQVVHNFSNQNLKGVIEFRTNLISYKEKFHFLKNDTIHEILNIDISDNILAFNEIQKKLDTFLKRTKKYDLFIEGNLLIEESTPYSLLLNDANPNFVSIRQISVNQWQNINESSVFYSLQRGVKVLTEEKQLFSYLYSYGKMHYKKMTTSFSYLPDGFYNRNIHIIDWGCGQGLATISLLDYFNESMELFKKVTLIEPSELAIKRASLHVQKLNSNIDILTIHKDLDSLTSTDFIQDSFNVKVHLFSNILDIDLFSLTQLVELIKKTFYGENYFVCASPFVNTLKTSRLDSFVKSFSTEQNFTRIKEINNRNNEWINGWTRVVRVFKVDL
jgi:2-polyprenyl-3-methyl-5-hydroxy-6-metoxy-1,4-benzoquinol methylase